MASIARPEKGAQTSELWRTVAELVDAVNALQNMQVSPPAAGKFVKSESNIVLELQTEKCPGGN